MPVSNEYGNGLYTLKVDMNAMQLTVTKTGEIDVNELLSDKLYLRGDAVPWKWDFDDPEARVLDKTAPGIYRIENVPIDVCGDNNCGFKVYPFKELVGCIFGQGADATDDNITMILSDDSGDPQFRPGRLGYSGGIYTIEMNFNTMKMTLTPVTTLIMRGSVIDDAWSIPVILFQINGDEYEADDVNMTIDAEHRVFKIFPGVNEWEPWYGQSQEEGAVFGDVSHYGTGGTATPLPETDPAFAPFTVGYTNGTYTVNLNTATLKLTLTKK
jgi:hypothetical protein